MPRPAIQAASIKDKFRICHEHAEHKGWTVARYYRESAISGDSMIPRQGIQTLPEGARHPRHLDVAGVTVVTLMDGEIDKPHVGTAYIDRSGVRNAKQEINV